MGHSSSKSTRGQQGKDSKWSCQEPEGGLSRSASTRSSSRGVEEKDKEDKLYQEYHRSTKSALADAPPSYTDAIISGPRPSSSNHLTVPGQAQNLTSTSSTNPFMRYNGSSSNLSQSSIATPSQDGYTPAMKARLEELRRPMRQESIENAIYQLKKYDTVLVVDDSGSMWGSRWAEARTALAHLADIAREHDENGLDIYFLNSELKITGCKDPKEVMRLFDTVRPNGRTPIGDRLNVLLNEYFDALDEAKEHKRALPKPINILMITDGAATDDPQSVIEYAAGRLDRGNFLLNQVGIQFVQIGDDPTATESLRKLDDDLAATGIRDIVDTTPYIGEISSDMIIKIMLGGINRREDKKNVKVY